LLNFRSVHKGALHAHKFSSCRNKHITTSN
jgi:hypothetical protein